MPTKTFINLDQNKRDRIYHAAINEFARVRYDGVKLSNIIKEAKIPRGSFYQYFEDKYDLYVYIFDEIAKKKIEYMGDLMGKINEMNFFDLFEQLYIRGARFGIDNPKLVDITRHLLASRDHIYDKLMANNINLAKQYYIGMIESSKEQGSIKEDVDTETLAELVLEMTMNVAVDNLVHAENKEEQFDKMIEIIKKRIFIFRKGIEIGE